MVRQSPLNIAHCVWGFPRCKYIPTNFDWKSYKTKSKELTLFQVWKPLRDKYPGLIEFPSYYLRDFLLAPAAYKQMFIKRLTVLAEYEWGSTRHYYFDNTSSFFSNRYGFNPQCPHWRDISNCELATRWVGKVKPSKYKTPLTLLSSIFTADEVDIILAVNSVNISDSDCDCSTMMDDDTVIDERICLDEMEMILDVNPSCCYLIFSSIN